MPRQARLDAPGTLHHVMIRGIEGARVFQDDLDRSDFVSRMGRLAEKTGTKVLAWVLMDNHVHLLMFSGHEGISKFMRRILTGYAIRYNLKHHRRGYLFQNRYKSIVCEEEPYLLELVRYIHLNPLRAGVVRSLKELDRYPWSGHRVLMGGDKNGWQEREYVLQQFSENTRRPILAYRRFMEEAKDQGRRPELVGGELIRSQGGWSRVLSARGKRERVEHDPRILGGGDFVAEMLREANKKLRRQLRSGEREASMEGVIRKMCMEAGVEEQEVRNGGQRRRVSKVRSQIAYHLSHELGISMAEIARNLGVCSSAIIKAVQKLESQNQK